VNYVDSATATEKGLAKVDSDGNVRLGVDTCDTLDSTATGRDSIRIESIDEYDEGLFIFDMAHLPASVHGVWPAIWTYNEDWPTKGDIDIYENWNGVDFNRQTLHTADDTCTIVSTKMTDTIVTDNCFAPYDQGCSANDEHSGAYGSSTGGVCK
jgi:hypothetical protein